MINIETIRTNWLYILFSRPKIYLYTLLSNTLIVGCVAFVLNYVYLHSRFATMHVPSTAHSLVGIAIGLLLVFRTSSAYERWSTASKNFNDIGNSLVFISMKLNTFFNRFTRNDMADMSKELKEQFNNIIKSLSENFRDYLKANDKESELKFEKAYLDALNKMMEYTAKIESQDKIFERGDTIIMQKSILDIINSCGSCVKIKNTPIPISYSMHIKVSIFIYILSLPFGLFADMGMWATAMVMIIYYIIAGIEIISREIEQPFFGDPNDLPIDEYFKKIQTISYIS